MTPLREVLAADASGLALRSAAMAGLGLAGGGLGRRLTFRLAEARV